MRGGFKNLNSFSSLEILTAGVGGGGGGGGGGGRDFVLKSKKC